MRLSDTLANRSDVTPRVDPQLSRAASLILSSLSFIHDLRNGQLQPDAIRGTALDMSQYNRLFGTCRVPTDVSSSFLYFLLAQTIADVGRGDAG
jgi:hypothetical protein